jgi:hypothetical protein
MRKPYNWDDLVYFLRKKQRMTVGRAVVQLKGGALVREKFVPPQPQPLPASHAPPVEVAASANAATTKAKAAAPRDK